jgi:hypothetical protein
VIIIERRSGPVAAAALLEGRGEAHYYPYMLYSFYFS